VQAEKANIAAEDPHVHWAQPTKAGLLTAYTGTGDQGRAHYDLLGMGGALYEVEGTISASNEAQGVKLGEIQDALALPFAGRPELNWYESQVKRIQSGTFPRTTKVFGRARVGLDFSAEGTVLVLRETVQPAD
jgi:hypothetical protein